MVIHHPSQIPTGNNNALTCDIRSDLISFNPWGTTEIIRSVSFPAAIACVRSGDTAIEVYGYCDLVANEATTGFLCSLIVAIKWISTSAGPRRKMKQRKKVVFDDGLANCAEVVVADS